MSNKFTLKKKMQIKDQDYVQQHGINQPRWFINFKTNLIVHLEKNDHIQAVQELLKTSSKKSMFQTTS